MGPRLTIWEQIIMRVSLRADLGKRFTVEPFEAATALLQQDPTLREALTMADVLSGLWPESCEQVRLP